MIESKSKKITLQKMLVYVQCLFAMSRGSFGQLIPLWWWLWGILGLTLVCFAFKLRKSGMISKDSSSLLILLLIVLCWMNYNVLHLSLQYEVLFFSCTMLAIVLSNSDKDEWVGSFYNIIRILGFIYSVGTIVSYLNKGIYNNYILPFITNVTKTTLYLNLSTYYSTGITNHYSTNAMYISMFVCCMCASLFFSEKKYKIVDFGLLLIGLFALLLTTKRAHVIFVVIAFLITYYVYNSNRKLKRWFYILGIIAILALAVYLLSIMMPDSLAIINRFIEGYNSDDVTNGRLRMWILAWDAFQKRPLLGNGWNWFKYNAQLNMLNSTNHVHNIYIQLLCEIGIIGTALFIGCMFFYLKRTIALCKLDYISGQIRRNLSFSLLYQLFFWLYGITGTDLYENQTIVIYFLCVAMSLYYWRKRETL